MVISKLKICLFMEIIYWRYQPSGVNLLEPFKAKRGHPLQNWQKRFNKWISSIRICSEHAICGIRSLFWQLD